MTKSVVNSNEGGNTPLDFSLMASGPVTLTGVTGDANITQKSVPAGEYTLSETNLPGYKATDYACAINGGSAVSGNIVKLENGQNVVCKITNNDIPPDITIEKALVSESGALAGVAEAGELLTYQITLTNTGGPTSNYAVQDILDSNVDLVSADKGGLLSGSVITWSDLTIPAATGDVTSTVTLTVVVKVKNPLPTNVTKINNLAKHTGSPDPICPSAQCVVIPTPGKMTIKKTGTLNDLNGNGLIDLGETISYSFLVTNTGGVTLTNVTVSDPLVTVKEPPQTLAPGSSFTFHADYTPTQADIDKGKVSNTATGTGTPPTGPPVVSPPDTVVINAGKPAKLEIEKHAVFNDTDHNNYTSIGDTITYTFIVTNLGDEIVKDVMPVDAGPTFNNKPASGKLSAFTPASVDLPGKSKATFTATYVLLQC